MTSAAPGTVAAVPCAFGANARMLHGRRRPCRGAADPSWQWRVSYALPGFKSAIRGVEGLPTVRRVSCGGGGRWPWV